MADDGRNHGRNGRDRRLLIGLRILLVVCWAAFLLVERSTHDAWGTAIVGILFLASVVNLWMTLKRTPGQQAPDAAL